MISRFGDASATGFSSLPAAISAAWVSILLNPDDKVTILGGVAARAQSRSAPPLSHRLRLSYRAMKLHHVFYLCLVILCSIALNGRASAQQQPPGQDPGFGQQIAGVEIDAAGVLRTKRFDTRVAQERLLAARQTKGVEAMDASQLRKVSLTRLEQAVAEAIDRGENPSDEMLSMAGLTSVQYVFFYPDSRDVVIAGPAEGVFRDPTGRFLGMASGQPIVQLEDMVTALRAYGPGAQPTLVISVSIDPTAEGLARMQQLLASLRGRVRPGNEQMLTASLKQSLGLQTVTLKGVPQTTNFARVLVEADYRMKLIGIGLERLPIPMQSYVDRSTAAQGSANAMQRWYFVPNYEGVAVSEDGLAMKLNDRGVKLVGESERVDGGGNRAAGGKINRASAAFCNDFTKHYAAIAQRVPVYAELRNLIDVAIAAAYIQQQDFYGQADWSLTTFADESRFPVQTHSAPAQVETAVNAVWKGNTLLTPLGGGINLQPRQALRSDRVVNETDGASDAVKQLAAPTDLAADQWWWD